MSQHFGTVMSFDATFSHGHLSQDENSGVPMQFDASHVEGLRSPGVGERVTFDIVNNDQQGHAENIQRVGGDLEAYQDFGGLYS